MRIDIPHRVPAVLAALIVLIVVAGGCGTTTTAANPPTATTPAGLKGFPVTIQNCGRTLTFDKPPTRVLTFSFILDELIELEVQNTVIGRARLDEDLDALPPGWKAIYQSIPVINASRLPLKEPMLASGADFVIGSYYIDFDASKGYATRDELEAAGIQSFIPANRCTANGTFKNYTFQTTFNDIRDLAKIFGVPQRADQVIQGLQTRIDNVTKRVENLKPVRVVTADPTETVFYAPGGGVYQEVVSHAGGINVFDGGESGYDEINQEKVAAADAQAYVIIQYLPDTPEQRIARIEAAAPNSEGVLKHRYAVVQNDQIEIGPRVVDGLEIIARVLHPEAFQ